VFDSADGGEELIRQGKGEPAQYNGLAAHQLAFTRRWAVEKIAHCHKDVSTSEKNGMRRVYFAS
jgi:hypothetical protein